MASALSLQGQLLQAATKGSSEHVKALTSDGADINAVDAFGHTALYRGVQGGKQGAVAVLITCGACCNATECERPPLLAACELQAFGTAQCLIEGGANVEGKGPTGRTPLMEAARTGSTSIMEMLMKAGARLTPIDADGATALLLAIEAGQPGAVKCLLKAGPEVTLRQGRALTTLAAKQVEANAHSQAALEVHAAVAAACQGAGEGKEEAPGAAEAK